MGKHRVVDTVFKAGKDAHDRGVLRALGPYRKGSPSYEDWILGWDAALRASNGDRSKLDQKADVVRIQDVELQKDSSEDIAVLGDIPTEK